MKIRYWGSMPQEDKLQISALQEIAQKHSANFEIEYIDVLSNAELALTENIFLTPTLERVEPLPSLRLIALPNDAEKIFLQFAS